MKEKRNKKLDRKIEKIDGTISELNDLKEQINANINDALSRQEKGFKWYETLSKHNIKKEIDKQTERLKETEKKISKLENKKLRLGREMKIKRRILLALLIFVCCILLFLTIGLIAENRIPSVDFDEKNESRAYQTELITAEFDFFTTQETTTVELTTEKQTTTEQTTTQKVTTTAKPKSSTQKTSAATTKVKQTTKKAVATTAKPKTTTKKTTTKAVKTTESSKEIIVYITDTGTKYHSEYCRTLKKSKYPISKDKALSQGYEPCGVCHPG